MTGTTLVIEPALLERARRLASAHGWEEQAALVRMFECGLGAYERELAISFNDADALAFNAAVEAMQQVPDDDGFGLIGKVGDAAAQ